MAAMGTEVHSLYGIQCCHLMYYEDVKINAHVRVYIDILLLLLLLIVYLYSIKL